MKLTYRGKSAIVTGACGGMGLEISKNLSKNNIAVLMIDLKKPPKNFLKDNQSCTYKKIDVTNYKRLKTFIDIFYKKNKQIDYLINTTCILWFDKDVSSVKKSLSPRLPYTSSVDICSNLKVDFLSGYLIRYALMDSNNIPVPRIFELRNSIGPSIDLSTCDSAAKFTILSGKKDSIESNRHL